MTRNFYEPGKENPHLPHDGVEIKSRGNDTTKAKQDADLLVSQLMQGSTKPGSRQAPMSALPKPAPTPRLQETPNMPDAGDAKILETVTERVRTEPAPATPPAKARVAPSKPVEYRDENDVKAQLREAFPELQPEEPPARSSKVPPALPVAVICGAVVLVWPTLLFWLLLTVGLTVLAFASLMRLPVMARLLGRGWGRIAVRYPYTAESLRKIADRLALGLERVLDLLPGSLADKLSLPDFSQSVPSRHG